MLALACVRLDSKAPNLTVTTFLAYDPKIFWFLCPTQGLPSARVTRQRILTLEHPPLTLISKILKGTAYDKNLKPLQIKYYV